MLKLEEIFNETIRNAMITDISRDQFEGIYGNEVINWSIVGLWFIGLFFCAALILVSWFEKSGKAGPFRTLVNQLISAKLDQIVFMYVFGTTFHTFRGVMGPQNEVVCHIETMVAVYGCISISLHAVAITATKFIIAYVFKSIPVIDDNFMTIWISGSIVIFSLLATMGKFYTEEKTMINERICTGVWHDKDMHLEPNMIAILVIVIASLAHIVLSVALWIKRKKANQQIAAAQNHYQITPVSNLGSYLASFMTLGSFLVGSISYILLTKFGRPEYINEYPQAWLAHLVVPIFQWLLVVSQCITQYAKNPHLRKSVKNLFQIQSTTDNVIPIGA